MLLHPQLKTGLLTIMTLGFGLGAIAPLPAQAVSFPSSTPSGGAPPRTASGAPRRNDAEASCIRSIADLDGDQSQEGLTRMTVLAPTSRVITSLNQQPTFFVYMPQINLQRGDRPFVTIDIDELVPDESAAGGYRYGDAYTEDLVSIPATVTDGPRIVAYASEEINLEPGKLYQWSISFSCRSDTFAPIESAIDGLIDCRGGGCNRQVELPDSQQLNPEELSQIAQDYANQGFWQETVQVTSQLRQFDRQGWQELLESQGLDCFAEVPFAEEPDANFTIEDDPQCFIDGETPQL